MANIGKTVATLVIGVVIGAAASYILATDKDRRHEDIEGLKDKVSSLQEKMKKKFKKKTQDLEQEIYNA
ncbi:MAG: hypothetical protein ABI378_10530 [Chitinophagaceae bacterium]